MTIETTQTILASYIVGRMAVICDSFNPNKVMGVNCKLYVTSRTNDEHINTVSGYVATDSAPNEPLFEVEYTAQWHVEQVESLLQQLAKDTLKFKKRMSGQDLG